MPQLTACTIVARNYLPYARVLGKSFSDTNGGNRLQVLVIDDMSGETKGADEPFDVITTDQLPLEERTLHEMAMTYGVLELATALKPTLIKLLRTARRGPVIYLDPDILVLGDLGELGRLAGQHGIVLTPHSVAPMPRDGRKPTEFDIMSSGVYNLGFLGVGPGGEGFLDWWAERLRTDAVVDHANMLFTDQRWVDLAMGYFDVHLVRDISYNVAYWNADRRPISRRGDTYLVGDRPLAFYHFSGFDPQNPHILSKHQGDNPRVRLSEHPALAELCDEYAELIEKAGYDEHRAVTYGWSTLPDGAAIDERMRRAFRTGLLNTETYGDPRPPDPFTPDGPSRLYDWLATPDTHRTEAPQMPRYLWEIYADRPDVCAAYPRVRYLHEAHYRAWLGHFGMLEEVFPEGLRPLIAGDIPWGTQVPSAVHPVRPGMMLVGYLHAELGVGEGARITLDTIEAAGIETATYSFGLTDSRQRHPFGRADSLAFDLDTSVICINSDQLPYFATTVGPRYFDGRYTVGLWAWETERLPASMAASGALVDEIWVPSSYTQAAVAASVPDRPVFVLPSPCPEPPVDDSLTRADLGLPEGFVFLFMFDFFSTIERKNPLGLIEAFRRAFGPGDGASLVFKTINGDSRVLDRERLLLAARGRDDIHLVDRYASGVELASMLANADCYVSLHRAEGFGLTMADAMSLGKPVIATGYSGNLDFMDSSTACLIPYDKAVVLGSKIYTAGHVWAEPDVDAAAVAMRRLFDHPDEATALGAAGRTAIRAGRTIDKAVEFVAGRHEAIQALRANGYQSHVVDAVRALTQ
ncbi:MAG TPA: glycosyltransferase family 4 protein [Acidimicrobiales bacterium]|nr:glycosyltransferase family 4 protein [Acidimicrobiales bacterium]